MQTVVTHSGSFDPDDVLAVAAVQLYLGVDNVEVIRSRDDEVVAQADWAIDVGGYYDVATNRFDHHQNGVPKRENGIPYSAFGLLWKEYGAVICDSEQIAAGIEERLAFPIDAADNHVAVSNPTHPHITPFEFFDVIDAFKPIWGSTESFNSEFRLAVDFARTLLNRMIAQAKGRMLMQEMIKGNYDAASDKSILVFENPVPRYEFVDYKEVKVVVSPVPATDVTNWMAIVIPNDKRTFDNRVNFPKQWAGLLDAELEKASNIPEAVFCHKERYIFVAKTKNAALKAAQQALLLSEEVV